MILSLLEAQCADCGTTFSCPQMGDFGYGTFLFHGERGTVHAAFEALGSPVWSYLGSMLDAVTDARIATARVAKLHAACAHFADPVAGQHLRSGIVCPHCHSTRMAWWGGNKTGSAEVTGVTFSRFLALSATERQELVSAFFEADRPAGGTGCVS